MKRLFLLLGSSLLALLCSCGGAASSSSDNSMPSLKDTGLNLSIDISTSKNLLVSLGDYIDDKGHTDIIYDLDENSTKLSVSTVTNGSFTITAVEIGDNQAIGCSLSIESVVVLSFSFIVDISDSSPLPLPKRESFDLSIDLVESSSLSLSLKDYFDNVSSSTSFKIDEQDKGIALRLNASSLSITASEKGTYSFRVSSYKYQEKGGTADFTVSVIKDLGYEVKNGGFETGDLSYWSATGSFLGVVSTSTLFWDGLWGWVEGFPYDGEGSWFASDDNDENGGLGTLTSSPFTMNPNGSGWISFRLGLASKYADQYVSLYSDGTEIARFGNTMFNDDADAWVSDRSAVGTSVFVYNMATYKYHIDLDKYGDSEMYFRIVDNAEGAGYSAMVVDGFYANLENEPEGILAINMLAESALDYGISNPGFEDGTAEGWMSTVEAFRTDCKVNSSPTDLWGNHYNKEGTCHFMTYDQDDYSEAFTGSLRSSMFHIGSSGWISFRLNGSSDSAISLSVYEFTGDGEDKLVGTFNNYYSGSIDESAFIMHEYAYRVDMDGRSESLFYFVLMDGLTSGSAFAFIGIDEIVCFMEADPVLDETPQGISSAGYVEVGPAE